MCNAHLGSPSRERRSHFAVYFTACFKGKTVQCTTNELYQGLKVGVFFLLMRFQPAYIQLYYFRLHSVAPRRLNQVMFQLKLQTFPFKHQICMVFFSLTQVLESSTAPALFHSLGIYKGTSPVWNVQYY